MKKKRIFFIVLFVCVILLIIYNYSGIELFRSYEKEFLIENQEAWHQQFSFKKEPMSSISIKLKGEVEGDLKLTLSDGKREWKTDIAQQDVNRYKGEFISRDWYSKEVIVTIASKKGKMKELRVYFDYY